MSKRALWVILAVVITVVAGCQPATKEVEEDPVVPCVGPWEAYRLESPDFNMRVNVYSGWCVNAGTLTSCVWSGSISTWAYDFRVLQICRLWEDAYESGAVTVWADDRLIGAFPHCRECG